MQNAPRGAFCNTFDLQREHSAILSTFYRLPVVIKTFVLSIFEWPYYTGFTVYLTLYMLVTSVNSLDPDQARHIGQDLIWIQLSYTLVALLKNVNIETRGSLGPWVAHLRMTVYKVRRKLYR